MKTTTLAFILLVCCVLATGCKKDESSTSSSFSNKLTMATSVNNTNPFILVNESTTFAVNSTVYFRLESTDDFENMAIHLIRFRLSGTSATVLDTLKYPAISNSGKGSHIMVSTFRTSTTAGAYRVTGTIPARSKTVASLDFTLN